VLIGQVGEGQPHASVQSLKHPNVHLLGPKQYGQIPDYLRGFDVATIPAPVNDYTASMFPMKFFEYLSAGRKIVISNVPALSEYHHVCCDINSTDQFIESIEHLLADDDSNVSERVQYAAQHTWDQKLDQMLEAIGSAWVASKS
jgi:hypothetical protein